MRRLFGLIVVATVALATLTVNAAAQDGEAVLTLDPANIEAPGEIEVTGTGAGFTEDGFLLPCPGMGGDLEAELTAESCDIAALTPYVTGEDGTWTATATVTVPAEGLVMVAGNASQTEGGFAVITVGAAAEATTTEGGDDEALADTGVESAALAIVAAALLLGGLMLLSSRRHALR